MKTKPTLFGRLVRKLRIDHNVVLKEMADAVGVSAAYVSAVELGSKKITDDFLEKTAKFFGLEGSEFSELKEAANVSQPSVTMELKGADDDDRLLVTRFARKLNGLSPEKKKKMLEMLED